MANIDVLTRWFEEVWNKGKRETIKEMVATTCDVTDLDAKNICGPDELTLFYDKMNEALEGIRIEIDSYVECGDKVAAIFTVNATHRKTRKAISSKAATIVTFEDGLITQSANVVDFLTLFTQAGILPEDSLPKGLMTDSVL